MSGKSDPKAPGGAPASQPRALLSAVVVAVNKLEAALDEVGLNRRLRESPSSLLRTLDRTLPDETLDDLIVGCEAFASVTGPSALATDDQARLRTEAQRYLRTLQTLTDTARGRRRLTLMGSTSIGTQNAFLRSVLGKPQVRYALEALIDPLTALAALAEGGTPREHVRLIPMGMGCVIPATVLGGAAALIFVLLASIALATGQAQITPNGLNIPLTSALPTATAKSGSTPTTRPGNPTPTTTPSAKPTPTSKPGVKPTTTPVPGYGVLSVSPNNVAPCAGSPDTFTVSYSGGQSSINWSSSSSDPANILLSPASGTLAPGGFVTVTVTASQSATTGSITVTPSHGSASTVNYDASQC
jgi:hypothetical protein